ncbi:winged helix-turn-helix domain-containing tetratricopeptide repeat protein [Mesorhizobium humile]|uniref:Winged helix-turn-helix domain-containing tetratricopeptide repeat protein n=1 Tax=Mesorhizobium humile TaxID=3072313 RepID=A0ABU4YDC6_9HYPH|nr:MULTISPECIES: winged helix-turn-helix domain-containing tetratricopeptide repeat protein [unclassified Mesorhizobium]MDX8459169.1 winged helix-turn-helix domain-containing tetratricopeptide repeat protein [Mesorhizobium sp. VK2D]MDX8484952.1 winged helix-turn-helix domain-containing tetratricopeptide repeat protein [Mesorhizobium sp. VK2B]
MTVRGDLYQFGPFRLDPEVGILFCGAEPTMLGQRAVALLRLLIQNAGVPVSKDALIDAGWGGSAVADNNLTVQIAALRRVLADAANVESWIETLPRRGYRYVGPTAVTVPETSAATRAKSAPSLPEKPSVAVLPFSNLSGDPQQEYFADGMVDDIITGLARIKWLFVVARNSTFSYKGRALDVKQVGRELGVRYVLEGSVRKAGDSVRVTTQMIDASTGAHVWAERYDRNSDDIFALQDEIALAAVGAIAPSVRKAEIERVRRKRPDSLDAYDLVLQAQPDVDSGMPEQVTRALVLLERAIALEPAYALAHGNAAMCHHCLFLRAGLQEINRASSIRHARAALVHGQDDALALTWAGFSIGMDAHDRAAAFAALEAALAISPSSALTYILGSVILGWSGEAERAIEWSEQGLRLSPFDSWAWAAFDAQAMSHLLRSRYDEACRAAYKAVQANPAHSITYVQLSAALAKLGRLDQARTAAARVIELQPAFRCSRQFAGVNCAPALAEVLGSALRAAGLPE